MIDPLRGVYINERYYKYQSSTWAEAFKLRNSVVDTQDSRVVDSVRGASFSDWTMTILLENITEVRNGEVAVGTTTWKGVSRLADLKLWAGSRGASTPIVFVAPYGVTYNTVLMGQLDIRILNEDNPSTQGTEFRVSLSLSQVK